MHTAMRIVYEDGWYVLTYYNTVITRKRTRKACQDEWARVSR